MLRLLLVSCFTFIVASCDYGVKWKDDPYEVNWIDISSNRALAYSLGNGTSIGRVQARVISVGSNKKYIVAKRQVPKTETVQYYFIDRQKDDKYLNLNQITQGPFTKEAFVTLKDELGLPEFSKDFE